MSARSRRPLLFSLAIGAAVFVLVFVVQQIGSLQRWELAVYDALLKQRHGLPAKDPRIVIIGLNEADIQAHDYPLRDGELAHLIDVIRGERPRVIGLDLFRNLAEPRSGAQLAELNAVLSGTENLVAIFSLPDNPRSIPAPPALNDSAERLGFNDFPFDGDLVRRGYLIYKTPEGGVYGSFALQMVQLYLQGEKRDPTQPPLDLELSPDDPPTLRLGRSVFRALTHSEGGYARVNAEGFQFLIDYKSPIEFTTFSFGDVLAGRVPSEQLKDRIVLIGGDADSVKDNLATPLSPSCRGVVLHAQVLNQLLRAVLDAARPTRSWPDWVEMAWGLAWACLGALCGFAAQRSAVRAALLFVLCLTVLGGVTIGAFFRDWWLPAIAPLLNYIISGTGAFALAFYRERRERAELMQLFSRHVSDKVAQSIWEQRDTFLDGNRPRPQKITATVLFTDFVGFSSVSELKDPASLLQWLNEGMERLAQQVEAHDGIVNKYIGDAIMAIFGVPVPRQSAEEIACDARNAVRCALAMSAELESLNTAWRASGVNQIGMRIGICTGPLVAGSMGSAARLEFTVIGDTVNTASRLESTKKEEIPPPAGRACRILVSESTWQQLGGLFESDFEAEEELKGKERKVKIRRIVAEKRRAIPEPLASSTP